MAGTPIGDLVVRVRGDTKDLDRSMRKAKLNIQGFRDSVNQIGAEIARFGAVAGAAVAALGFQAVKAAANAEETRNKFNVVFSDVRAQADKTAKELAKGFGLSSSASERLLSDTADLLSGFGFTQQAALDMSTQVQKLAADLASFANVEGGAEEASRALTAGLLGERESMKRLGIAINENTDLWKSTLKQVERATGMTGIQAKAQATLQIALMQSKNAIGDFQRSQGSLTNQTRILMSEIEDLRVEIGEELKPVAEAAVKAARSLIKEFRAWRKSIGELDLGALKDRLAGVGAGFLVVKDAIKLVVATGLAQGSGIVALSAQVLRLGEAANNAAAGMLRLAEAAARKGGFSGAAARLGEAATRREAAAAALGAQRVRAETPFLEAVKDAKDALAGLSAEGITANFDRLRKALDTIGASTENGAKAANDQADGYKRAAKEAEKLKKATEFQQISLKRFSLSGLAQFGRSGATKGAGGREVKPSSTGAKGGVEDPRDFAREAQLAASSVANAAARAMGFSGSGGGIAGMLRRSQADALRELPGARGLGRKLPKPALAGGAGFEQAAVATARFRGADVSRQFLLPGIGRAGVDRGARAELSAQSLRLGMGMLDAEQKVNAPETNQILNEMLRVLQASRGLR